MKYFLLFILIVITYFILRILFFKTKIGRSIKYNKVTNRRLKKLSQAIQWNSAFENSIVNDVKSKTAFDLSRARLMVYIDYSTQQLGSEEAYFVANDISQFIEQANTLNFGISEIRMSQRKLDILNKLIRKATRNKRPSKLNSSNCNLINAFDEHKRCENIFQGYYLSGRGEDEFHQGDVSIIILPELSLIIISKMHW